MVKKPIKWPFYVTSIKKKSVRIFGFLTQGKYSDTDAEPPCRIWARLAPPPRTRVMAISKMFPHKVIDSLFLHILSFLRLRRLTSPSLSFPTTSVPELHDSKILFYSKIFFLVYNFLCSRHPGNDVFELTRSTTCSRLRSDRYAKF